MHKLLAIALSAVLLALTSPSGAIAAPLNNSQSTLNAAQSSIVQQVHGCHRNWRRGRAGTHRHVGRRCARIARYGKHRGRGYRHRGRRCETTCYGIGPLRVCDRDCD